MSGTVHNALQVLACLMHRIYKVHPILPTPTLQISAPIEVMQVSRNRSRTQIQFPPDHSTSNPQK